MLAGVRDYLHAWQLAPLAVFVVGWLVGGAWLLGRSLRKRGHPRKVSKGRCLLICILAGMAAVAVGGVFFRFVQAIGSLLTVELRIAAAVVGIAVMIPTAFLVVYAMLDLSIGTALRVATPAMVLVLVLAAVLGATAVVPAYFIHRTEAKKKYCEDQLRELAIALETHQRRTGNPAASPKTVVDEGLIGEAYLSCPAAAGKKPAYFHRPGRIIEAKEPTRQVLTCDLGGNHKGGRNVMFANRQCFWYTEREFQDLLNRPENQKFAEALRAAQGP